MQHALSKTLVLATANPGKQIEFAELLSPLGLTVVPLSSVSDIQVEEPFDTFVENALHKARHASRLSGLPALADDSGLCVTALNGAPGVKSARYAQDDEPWEDSVQDARNNLKLLSALATVTNREAYYYAVWVYVRHASDPQPLIAEGCWWGEIANKAMGTGGFGYDPVFWVPTHDCTAAQLPLDLKNRISHRGQAARQWTTMSRPPC